MVSDKKIVKTEFLENVLIEVNKTQGDYSEFFSNLKKNNDTSSHAEILNYILENTEDLFIAKLSIIEISKLMHPASLDILIDFIIIKDKEHFTKGLENCDLTAVKVLCVKVISNYKDTRAIVPLSYCLNNKGENYKFRLAVAEALGRIGDKNAVDPLINIVKDEEEKSVYVRESAAMALGMIGDMRAIEPFLEILEGKKSFLDKFTFLKERVIEALGKIDFTKNKRVINALEEALEDESSQVKLNALESISNANCTELFEPVKKLLDDEDEDVVKSAVIALYNISDRKILDEIIDNPKSNEFAKQQAIEIIEEYEDEDAE